MRFMTFQPQIKRLNKEELLQMAAKAVADGKIKRVKNETDFDGITFALAEAGVATFDIRLHLGSPGSSMTGVSK